MAGPIWYENFDDNDDTYYEAYSPYCASEDGDPMYWRLKPRIKDGHFEWYEAHDAELIIGEPESWPTLTEAKEAISAKHAEIIRINGLVLSYILECSAWATLIKLEQDNDGGWKLFKYRHNEWDFDDSISDKTAQDLIGVAEQVFKVQ